MYILLACVWRKSWDWKNFKFHLSPPPHILQNFFFSISYLASTIQEVVHCSCGKNGKHFMIDRRHHRQASSQLDKLCWLIFDSILTMCAAHEVNKIAQIPLLFDDIYYVCDVWLQQRNWFFESNSIPEMQFTFHAFGRVRNLLVCCLVSRLFLVVLSLVTIFISICSSALDYTLFSLGLASFTSLFSLVELTLLRKKNARNEILDER